MSLSQVCPLYLYFAPKTEQMSSSLLCPQNLFGLILIQKAQISFSSYLPIIFGCLYIFANHICLSVDFRFSMSSQLFMSLLRTIQLIKKKHPFLLVEHFLPFKYSVISLILFHYCISSMESWIFVHGGLPSAQNNTLHRVKFKTYLLNK